MYVAVAMVQSGVFSMPVIEEMQYMPWLVWRSKGRIALKIAIVFSK